MSSVILKNLVKSYDGKKNIIDNINLPINKITLKNRILYITGKKDNQRDCY